MFLAVILRLNFWWLFSILFGFIPRYLKLSTYNNGDERRTGAELREINKSDTVDILKSRKHSRARCVWGALERDQDDAL